MNPKSNINRVEEVAKNSRANNASRSNQRKQNTEALFAPSNAIKIAKREPLSQRDQRDEIEPKYHY